MSDAFSMRVEAAPTFRRNLRKLSKRYRSIQADVQPVIEQLKQGECPGDRIPGLGYEVFKLRVRNRDIQKGKSGGYRLIYYLKTANSILLLTVYVTVHIPPYLQTRDQGLQRFSQGGSESLPVYSKSEQDDITAEDISQIIQEDL